jgi:CRP/FNR family transcriptional regulator
MNTSLNPAQQITSLFERSPHTVAALQKVGRIKRWESGQVILSRGEVCTSAILLLAGRIRMMTHNPNGHEHLFRWLEQGEMTGLSALIAHAPFSADMMASGAVEALHIDREQMLHLIRTDGEVAVALLQLQSIRVNQLVDHIVDNTLGSLENKVWAALERLAHYHGHDVSGNGIELRLSHSDIAQAVDASRQRVSMALQKLEREGKIRLGYRQIVLI